MAVHQITCTNRSISFDGSHDHITYLGLGTSAGWHQRITVADAITQLRSPYGDRYFTISPTTTVRADVIEGGCEVCGQTAHVRTRADRVRDNNLKALPICHT